VSSYFILAVKEAYLNLVTTKLKSFLAMLGIWVGAGSIVAMICVGELATEAALAQFKQLGTDLLAVSMYEQGIKGSSSRDLELTENDIDQLAATLPMVSQVAPYTTVYSQIYFGGKAVPAVVIGATHNLADVIKIELASGRFISFLDGTINYCVIGNNIYQQLQKKGIKDPVGMQIQVGKKIFTIIGVAKPWQENAFFNQNINKSIIIPLLAAKRLSTYAVISEVVLKLTPEADIDKTQRLISEFIQKHSLQKQIFFQSAKRLIASLMAQRQTLALLLGAVGAISLLMGGVGIMNVMLVSIVERRREIGIRRAVGAKQSDIQFLFLIEAVVLAFSGGTLGVITGIIASVVIAHFADWPYHFLWQPALIGFVISVMVGIFFGFYPAYKASRLDPITTLREE
jgi:putative ABC transport system permease protein